MAAEVAASIQKLWVEYSDDGKPRDDSRDVRIDVRVCLIKY